MFACEIPESPMPACECVYGTAASGTAPGAVATGLMATGRYRSRRRTDHSCRKASTGSRREARTAGYSPKIKPTAAETPNDMAIEFQVTSVFHSA